MIGIYHSNSEDERIYWDDSISHLQKSLNQVLPDSDVYWVDFNRDVNTYLLYTENDYTPGLYYLGNRKEKSITPILEWYPELAPKVLTGHTFVTYTARDGTELEGYLTLPLDVVGPVPTIYTLMVGRELVKVKVLIIGHHFLLIEAMRYLDLNFVAQLIMVINLRKAKWQVGG